MYWMKNLGLLLFLTLWTTAAVPLALGKISPNPYYGFRTSKTMSDPRVWDTANRKLGFNMLVAAVAMLLIWGVAGCSFLAH